MRIDRTSIMILIGLILVGIPSTYAAYQVGDTVANFTLNDTEGNPFVLDDYQGMAIVINFWSST